MQELCTLVLFCTRASKNNKVGKNVVFVTSPAVPDPNARVLGMFFGSLRNNLNAGGGHYDECRQHLQNTSKETCLDAPSTQVFPGMGSTAWGIFGVSLDVKFILHYLEIGNEY